MKALQGPLLSWYRPKGYRQARFMAAHQHPKYLAVKLTPRGAGVTACERLVRLHGEKLGAWHVMPAEKIPSFRPVWVAGFRRMPTQKELEQGLLLTPTDF